MVIGVVYVVCNGKRSVLAFFERTPHHPIGRVPTKRPIVTQAVYR